MVLTHVVAPNVLTGVIGLVWLEEVATGDTNVVNLPPSFSLNPLRLAA